MKKDLLDILKTFAVQHGVDWKILYAIFMKESDGVGFYPKINTIKFRFEQHIFNALLKNKLWNYDRVWLSSHTQQQKRMMATSYGIAQILGCHYQLLNYDSVEEMVQRWKDVEEIQVRDFCLFCVRYNNGRFLTAVKNRNLESIAHQYNGPKHEVNNYVPDLIKHIQNAKE